ncbi:ectoine synthase [Microbacterium suaedae]|uniref:ectoine synthase n=1 Tax=Microbacterium suaedae TaxID=2067813 RepID=UPI000DAD0880|nr:ectoine synthase [Microbacterium suaedae]
MIVRTLDEIDGSDSDIRSENWRSKRIVLAKEGVGFSLHETTLYAGTESSFWYANHIEAVFITHGEGEIEDLATGEVHPLKPGTMYLLNDHDKHIVRVREEIRCVCVFNPPITGREVHDENGVYPLVKAETASV